MKTEGLIENLIPYNLVDSAIVEFSGLLPPPVDPSRILINVATIEEICQKARISRLEVTGNSDGEMAVWAPEVSGFSPGGHPRISGYTAQLISPYELIYRQIPRQDHYKDCTYEGKFKVNLPEIHRKVLSQTDIPNGVRNPQPWAEQLDLILHHGLKEFSGISVSLLKFKRRSQIRQLLKQPLVTQ